MPAVDNALTTLRILVFMYGVALVGQVTSGRALGFAEGFDPSWVNGLTILVAVTCGCFVALGQPSSWRWSTGMAAVIVGYEALRIIGETSVATSEQNIPAAWGIPVAWAFVWTVGDHAPRMAVPLVLAGLWRCLAQPSAEAARHRQLSFLGATLCAASAAMFLVHAAKLIGAPESVDLLLTRSLGRWNGYQLQAETVRAILLAIGGVHCLAVTLLICGARYVPLCYMALWGMMTALSRVSAFGLFAGDEALLRAANGGAAMAALFLWTSRESYCRESCLHQENGST